MTSNAGPDIQAGIVDGVAAYWRTAILRAAFELHVPDHLEAGRTTPVAIAEREGADARSLGILMDALCPLGMLEKTEGGYQVRSHLRALLPSFGRMAPYYLNAENWAMWGRVSEAVRSGCPVGERDGYWVDFASGTRDLSRQQGAQAAAVLDLEPGRGVRVLDLGCGAGGLGYAFALADPTVRVTGLDSADVLAVAADHARELGIADRVTHRPTDVVTAPTLGDREHDVAILANLVHLLDAPTNRDLVRRVFDALAPGGRALVIDILADDERCRAAYPLMFAVEMMLRTPGGRTYTLSEISGWLADAGFEHVDCRLLRGHESAVVATRPGKE